MTAKIELINIYVACPSELESEKQILERIVEEINRDCAESLGFLYKVTYWASDIVPGIDKYPQEVINKQISGKFDILIALFWTRIGTPTPDYESGTVEEIEKAIEHNKKEHNLINIMVYFKNEPVILDKIDVDQLSRLKKYRSSLADRGVLYCEFNNPTEFESKIRSHLSKTLHNIPAPSELQTKIMGNDQKIFYEEKFDADELGFFDFVEINVTENKKASTLVHDFGESLNQMNEKTNAITNEISIVLKMPNKDLALYRSLVNRQAHNWDIFIANNQSKISQFKEANKKSQDSLTAMIKMSPEFGRDQENYEQLESIYKALVNLKVNTQGAYHSSKKIIEVTTKVPNLTKELVLSKKKFLQVYTEWCDALSEAIAQMETNKILSKTMLESW